MKLLKKTLCGILSATMLITSVSVSVMAENDIQVQLDGNTLSFDVPPQIINDRTMVPLRAIFEALGASVDWNQETKTVTSTKGDTTIKLTIDSNTMYVNGNAVTLDTPACVVNDRTLVPVRAISEAYNTNVNWDGDAKTVVISSNTVTATIPPETTNTAFSKVKDYIIKNGTQNVKTEDEEYYVFVDNGDLLLKQNLIIMLSYNVDTDTVNMYLGQSSNATYDEGIATLNIYIKENTEPKLEFYVGEMVQNSLSTFEIYGYFDKNTHKFVETETKNFGKTAKLSTTEHNLFNSYLQLFGMGYLLANTGAMLDELGIVIDYNNSNITTENTSTTQSSYSETTEIQSNLPLLNHEYGPMTINNNYSSGKHWYTNNISSLVFTKCETTLIGKYKLFLNMQGITDHDLADVRIYFYDNNNRVLDEVRFFHDVAPNVEYNVLDSRYVDEDVIDNAVRIEFYSYTGEQAIIG